MTTPTDAPRRKDPFRWVAIRSLSQRHRPRVLDHLLALDGRDRYLRFGHAASDAEIARYVDHIDFDTDEVLAIFNRRLEIIAMAHLACLSAGGAPSGTAEFGVSVDAHERGRGLGARLFDLAALHARNRGVHTLLIQALCENAAMLHIARAAGAKVETDGPEATARLKLADDDWASHLDELVTGQAAEIDYGFKVQARRLDTWIEQWLGVPPDSRAIEEGSHAQVRGGTERPPV